MGNQSTKVVTSVPRPIIFFPSFTELENNYDADGMTNVHQKLLSVTQWIARKLLPPGNEVLAEIVSELFSYLLNFVPKRYLNNNSPNSSNNLEQALLCAKVEEVTATNATSEFHAKIYALKNRYNRLLSDTVPNDDKKFEVVPALQVCEEILDLFRNENYVFWKHCLISARFLVGFASLYAATAILSVPLIPTYKPHLIKQLRILKNTVISYKEKCISERLSAITVKNDSGESLMDSVLTINFQKTCHYVSDSLLEKYQGNATHEEFDGSANAALEYYKANLIKQYNSFFETVIKTLDNLSETD